MKDLFLTCLNLLEKGEDVVMVTIIDQNGSAPRTAGSRMLVRRDGAVAGTIGGGIFEAKAIRMARAVFQSGQAVTRAFRFSGSEVLGMDMICGGRAEIFADLLRSGEPENAAVCKAIDALRHCDQDARIVTRIVTGPGSEDQMKLSVIVKGENPVGMSLAEEDRHALDRACKGRHPLQVKLGETRYLIEPVPCSGIVYIFGAGHVSQKLAYLTPFVYFRTVIVDDREEYANRTRFPQADRILIPASMENCMKDLPISENSYIVIVTRGHAHDMTVLAQALRTDAGYIGMIGSKRKRDMIYQQLRLSGVREASLARVHSPIGTDIKAETPEEIAVSIVGELIQARADRING